MIRSFNQRRKFKRLFRKKRDLKLTGLMSEKFSQKLRELSANEKIHNDISIQELIAILEESKNEILILQYDTKRRDFGVHTMNVSQSLFKYRYRLFDIEMNDEKKDYNSPLLIRLTYVLEGTQSESLLLNKKILQSLKQKNNHGV